jgi:hypothetical protein
MTPAPSRPAESSPVRALALPATLGAALIAFAFLSRQNATVFWSFLAAAGLIIAWTVALYVAARRARSGFALEILARKQHWMQACAQGTVLLYWGWHTRLVYPFLPFIVGQLIFAYAFDSLLSFTRRKSYTLGFGPFPVIFSINLFLWFKLDWFYWQLAMVAGGFAAKELIRWRRDGKLAHIFNPSSFPLAVASLALIVTRRSDITFGAAIANTQADVPNLYLVIFLVALPGQLLFGVARLTLASVVTMYAISVAYFASTGTYLFYDAHIPVQVFLGMHLLFTDPSTSPRSELGRIAFGMMYAVLTIVFFLLLDASGMPTFYDKLLPVPLMNLAVRAIERWTARPALAAIDPSRWGRVLSTTRRNVVYTVLWAIVFAVMSAAQGVGDRHPGQYLPFWKKACEAGSARACTYAANLTTIYCANGSGWACNEVGVLRLERGQLASAEFRRGCELGFVPACENANRPATSTQSVTRARPLPADLPIVLRGTKPPLREREPSRLYAIGCEQGWRELCATPPANQPHASPSPWPSVMRGDRAPNATHSVFHELALDDK